MHAMQLITDSGTARTMRLLADDKILFLELKRYLRDSMPQCANISVIVNNLVVFGGFKTVAHARHALKWGNNPFVVPRPLSNEFCANRFGHAKCAFESGTRISSKSP